MNAIFGAVVVISVAILIFVSPNSVLSAFLTGGENALSLSLKLAVVYAVWLGIFGILDKSGLAGKTAKSLSPFNKMLFGSLPDKAEEYVSLNISANILGMSGATTPYGIKAVKELAKHKNTDYQTAMFFVINATSIQLIPSSVLALRTELGSINPSDIILPTILATALSTVIGVLLVKIFIKKNV